MSKKLLFGLVSGMLLAGSIALLAGEWTLNKPTHWAEFNYPLRPHQQTADSLRLKINYTVGHEGGGIPVIQETFGKLYIRVEKVNIDGSQYGLPDYYYDTFEVLCDLPAKPAGQRVVVVDVPVSKATGNNNPAFIFGTGNGLSSLKVTSVSPIETATGNKEDVKSTTSPVPKPKAGANTAIQAKAELEQKHAVQTESLLPKPLPVANATAQPQAEQQRKLAVQAEQARQQQAQAQTALQAQQTQSPLPKPLPGANATTQAQAEQARQQQAQAQTALQAQQIESPLPKPLPGANATTQAQTEQQRQQEMQQRIQKQEELARQQNERASQAARDGDLRFRLALAERDAQVVQQVQKEKAEQARQERISQHQQVAQQEQALGAAIGLINTFQSAVEEGAQQRAAKEQAAQEQAERKRQEQAAREHAVLEEELQHLDNLNDMAAEAGRRLGDVGLQLKIYTSREELDADIKKAETEKAAREQAKPEAAQQNKQAAEDSSTKIVVSRSSETAWIRVMDKIEPWWAAQTDPERNKTVSDPQGISGDVLQVWGEHGWWATFRSPLPKCRKLTVRGEFMFGGGDAGP